MKILAAMLLSVIMLSSGFMINSPATAAPNENANDKAKRSFQLPEGSIEIAPGMYFLGSSIHDGKVVQGIAIFHHRPGHDGGPGGGGNGGGGNGGGEKCFTLISKGAKWKGDSEPWVVDGTNSEGLSTSDVANKIADAITEWEDIDDNPGTENFDILGNGGEGTVDRDSIGEDANGFNEIMFADISTPGAIAVNISWGFFFGPPQTRELVEWDQVYDDADFDWSFSGDADKMDFLNIATHEVGHATGLSHPSDTCIEETMYAFAEEEETKKQSIESGDIAGIQELYG